MLSLIRSGRLASGHYSRVSFNRLLTRSRAARLIPLRGNIGRTIQAVNNDTVSFRKAKKAGVRCHVDLPAVRRAFCVPHLSPPRAGACRHVSSALLE